MSASGTPDQPADGTPPTTDSLTTTPYGPQTPAIRRFLQRFAALSSADWDRAAAEYAGALGTAAHVAADHDLARAVERAGRTAERDAVLGPLGQLVRVPAPESDAENPDAPVAMHPVAESALAALLALVVRDVLPPRAFTVLYAPYAGIIPTAALDG